MPSAISFVTKLNRMLRDANLTERDVYKRIITQSGGDKLIGRPARTVMNEWLLDPPPYVIYPNKSEPVVAVGSEQVQAGDLILQVSRTAVTREDIRDPNLMLVFKDRMGGEEEVYFIVGFSAVVYKGEDIAFNLLIRSKSRPQ